MVTFSFRGTCSGKRGGFQSAFEEEIRRVMVHVFALLRIRTREREELLMRSKEDKIGVVPRGTVKVIFVLSAAMFHVERLLRSYNLIQVGKRK
jgi:hypothetical protein